MQLTALPPVDGLRDIFSKVQSPPVGTSDSGSGRVASQFSRFTDPDECGNGKIPFPHPGPKGPLAQLLRSLDDEPRQKVMLELRRQFYPDPLGRSTMGERARERARQILASHQVEPLDESLSRELDRIAACAEHELG